MLEAPIGQGGTGTVWRARRADGRFEGAVAIKLLHPSLVGRTGALRFEREGEVLARLAHPNIARLLDAGVTAGGQPYLVLELVDGRAHRPSLRRPRGWAWPSASRCFASCSRPSRTRTATSSSIATSSRATSWSAATATVKLLDFGIAKLLQADDGGAERRAHRAKACAP